MQEMKMTAIEKAFMRWEAYPKGMLSAEEALAIENLAAKTLKRWHSA